MSKKDLHKIASKYILVDHLDVVYDIEKSKGNFLYDKKHDRMLLDAFSFIASNPLGHNHPKLSDPDFERKLLKVAKVNPSNSDILCDEYVEFLESFFKIAVPDYFRDSFFIAGGTLAVENALKTAFDWKYKKLLERGIKINYNSLKVVHFKNAFHGRSGYSLTLTNTADPRKYDLFPKFPNWPRLSAPALHTSMSHGDQLIRDAKFLNNALDVIECQGNECAAIIIEPIQGEGGDNHFTKDFHKNLRWIADHKEMLLIYDEVQTGVGLTGKMWAHQLYQVIPDIISFGKKMQVCGILSGDRVREVKNNVFEEKSRINSTWGGNLVDMVRAQKYLEIIQEESLVENARVVGTYLLEKLQSLGLENVRGAGLMCAGDLPTTQERDAVIARCLANGLFILGCGTKSIRVRPSLTFSKDECDLLVEILRKSL
jgi:L-lysine 6-transaminase